MRKNGQITDAGEAAKEHTAEAIETLRAICVHGRDEMARVVAASALLDRAYGIPQQQVPTVFPRRDAKPAGQASQR